MTADSVCLGRLYVYDFAAFPASVDRVVALAANHQVACVIGTHIEMTTEPGVDYERGAPVHYDERELELGTQHLLELRGPIQGMGEEMRHEEDNDFIVYPSNTSGRCG